MELQVEQPGRKPPPPKVIARVKAATGLGFKVLKGVPRIRAFHITDPTEEYFLKQGKGAELKAWIDKAIEVARAIEARGVGFATGQEIGERHGRIGPGIHLVSVFGPNDRCSPKEGGGASVQRVGRW